MIEKHNYEERLSKLLAIKKERELTATEEYSFRFLLMILEMIAEIEEDDDKLDNSTIFYN